jgi:hypothetical protein
LAVAAVYAGKFREMYYYGRATFVVGQVVVLRAV